MSHLEAFIEATKKYSTPFRRPIVCEDGFKMSVQASRFHYCTPRVTGLNSYDSYEVGYPSAVDELLIPYAEPSYPTEEGEAETPYTERVYGYVPAGVVEEVIQKHGGIKGAKPVISLSDNEKDGLIKFLTDLLRGDA